MTFNVEVVLKGSNVAVTESVVLPASEPATWTDPAVREMLVEVLRAIDRVQNPDAPRDRGVVLQGFSWIVEPADDHVVLAIEIPMGAAVAGPFDIGADELTAQITRVIQIERQMMAPHTVH